MADPVSVEARLRDFQSITDAALSRLDDRDLLAELLDRTREVLQADTAAVLLLDFDSGQLIATAAAGLEEEVSQGVRIPVGRGFAGRIAAEHKPVVLDRVDHTTVLNPILWAKGILNATSSRCSKLTTTSAMDVGLATWKASQPLAFVNRRVNSLYYGLIVL